MWRGGDGGDGGGGEVCGKGQAGPWDGSALCASLPILAAVSFLLLSLSLCVGVSLRQCSLQGNKGAFLGDTHVFILLEKKLE